MWRVVRVCVCVCVVCACEYKCVCVIMYMCVVFRVHTYRLLPSCLHIAFDAYLLGSVLGAPEFVPQAFARTFPLVLVRGLAARVRVSEETKQVSLPWSV